MTYSDFVAVIERRLKNSGIRRVDVLAGANKWWNRARARGLSWENTIRRCVEDVRLVEAHRQDWLEEQREEQAERFSPNGT